ncbi:hypothetical protein ACET3Z_018149 [Daucus carota]
MLRKYVRSDLGYIGFKLYWHKSGFLFNDVNCKLLWDDSGIEELKKLALESGRIDVYVDHASDVTVMMNGKKGRPSKVKNVQVMEPPAKVPPVSVDVYTSTKDGNTYFLSVGGSTVKISSSKPPPPKPPMSSSQPVPSLKIFNRRSKDKQSSRPP